MLRLVLAKRSSACHPYLRILSRRMTGLLLRNFIQVTSIGIHSKCQGFPESWSLCLNSSTATQTRPRPSTLLGATVASAAAPGTMKLPLLLRSEVPPAPNRKVSAALSQKRYSQLLKFAAPSSVSVVGTWLLPGDGGVAHVPRVPLAAKHGQQGRSKRANLEAQVITNMPF